MHAHDEATWRVPLFHGTLKARDGAFHIWDATDDFSAVSMDLLFDGTRLHLHNATGRFGAVPMAIHGMSLASLPLQCVRNKPVRGTKRRMSERPEMTSQPSPWTCSLMAPACTCTMRLGALAVHMGIHGELSCACLRACKIEALLQLRCCSAHNSACMPCSAGPPLS